jgi:hypothetical protein
MDIGKIVTELKNELLMLDEAIGSLETLLGSAPKRRRGRPPKGLSEQNTVAVDENVKSTKKHP